MRADARESEKERWNEGEREVAAMEAPSEAQPWQPSEEAAA